VEQYTIEIEARGSQGSAESRRLRKDNKIPCVVYERGGKAISSVLSTNQFTKVAERSRTSQVFTFKSKTLKELDGRAAVVKEIQKDYQRNLVNHVDFLAIRDNEELTVMIPVACQGIAPGVKNDGGILTIVARELKVRCLPKQIPAEIHVDISALNLGDSIHAHQVPLPKGVTLAGNPEETVVSVVAIRVVEEETTTTAAAPADGTAAAAAPAEGAAGATPAAGAAAAAPAKEPAAKK
jgi:large subunit ribosomal protein L25